MDLSTEHLKRVAQGSARSLTMWFAALLAAFGAVQANLDHLRPLCGNNAEVFGYITIAIAVVVAVLRILTTMSLADKAPE